MQSKAMQSPNSRNRYMWHLFPDPSKAPETVTCDTFSFVPPQAQKPLHVTPFPYPFQTPDTVTYDTFSLFPPNPRNRMCC
jgi:hypothetical protein